MAREIKYYIVAADALPEIFVKVAEAKRMMQTGEADTVGAATRQVGISRSAFYKYKDAVQPFNDMKAEQIITFYCHAQGQHRRALRRAVCVCHLRGQYPDHQPEHSHQRLRGGDHLRGDQSEMEETLEELMAEVSWRSTAWCGLKFWRDNRRERKSMIQIAIMGLGTVGTGVAKVVAENARQIERKLGEPLQVKTILVRHFKDGPYRQLMTDDFTKIEEDRCYPGGGGDHRRRGGGL